MSDKSLYIFLDEGGNFDFSPSGTKYFTITSISTTRPFNWCAPLSELKYDLIQHNDLDLEYFHAAEDRQRVRDRVFAIVGESLDAVDIDTVVMEKRKTDPVLRSIEKFYPRMIGYLLQYIFKRYNSGEFEKFIIMTDRIPNNKKRNAIEKALKLELAKILPAEKRYLILHHASMSCFGIQMADYCNWAIFRKWERKDERSYALISKGIKSEFDIFRAGTRHYY